MVIQLKGDIQRILSKKSFWVAFILAILSNVGIVLFYLYKKKYSSFNFASGNIMGVTSIVSMIIGIAVFLAVYADDFKSMTIISIIGRGNSRLKVIIAKFINSVIITGVMFIILALQVVIMAKFMGIEMTHDEALSLCLLIIYEILLTIGYVTMAAIAIYGTGNVAFSVFMVVMLYLIIPTALSLTSLIPVLKSFNLSRYEYNGLLTTGFSSIILGMTASGIVTLILSFIIYVGASLAIIYAIFRKKELDF